MRKIFLCLGLSLILGGLPTISFALTPEQNRDLEGLVQHYCYVTHNLFMRACKDKDSKLFLSPANEQAVQHIKPQFEQIKIFQNLYINNQEEQALNSFGTYIIDLCNHFNLRDRYIFAFDKTSFADYSVDEKLAYIDKATKALEQYYETIKPTLSFLKQLENIFFYNFASTQIAPTIIRMASNITSFCWMLSIIHNATDQHQQGRLQLPFFTYAPIGHNTASNNAFMANVGVGAPAGTAPCTFAQNNPFPIPAHVCNRGRGTCYEAIGYQVNPAAYGLALLWSLRFTSVAAIGSYAAHLLKEAQLPTYLNRLKLREQEEKRKQVESEMRNLKIIYENEIDFSQIKGHRELIDNKLQLFVDYLNHPLKYNDYGGRISVVLYGDPGTGKTLLARAIAKESGAPCVQITLDDILNKVSNEKVSAIWKLAEQCAAQRKEKSAIIYIDEIDCVVGDRTGGTLDADRSKALGNLLSIFDGIEKSNPYIHLLVIITTNHYKNLDKAFIRSGRADHKIHVKVPNENGRKEFFDALLPKENKEFMNELITKTNGLSGADIILLMKDAQMRATFNNRTLPTLDDYNNALTTIRDTERDIEAIN